VPPPQPAPLLEPMRGALPASVRAEDFFLGPALPANGDYAQSARQHPVSVRPVDPASRAPWGTRNGDGDDARPTNRRRLTADAGANGGATPRRSSGAALRVDGGGADPFGYMDDSAPAPARPPMLGSPMRTSSDAMSYPSARAHVASPLAADADPFGYMSDAPAPSGAPPTVVQRPAPTAHRAPPPINTAHVPAPPLLASTSSSGVTSSSSASGSGSASESSATSTAPTSLASPSPLPPPVSFAAAAAAFGWPAHAHLDAFGYAQGVHPHAYVTFGAGRRAKEIDAFCAERALPGTTLGGSPTTVPYHVPTYVSCRPLAAC
jgi:hypothetical protein